MYLQNTKNYTTDEFNHFYIEFSRGEKTKPQSLHLLSSVIQCIEQRIADEILDIHVISKDLGISTRQLQRKIKAISNKSPNCLIRSIRLFKAKKMLQIGQKNVRDIAFSTGFNSVSYFSKCFKREFGIPPSDISQFKPVNRNRH